MISFLISSLMGNEEEKSEVSVIDDRADDKDANDNDNILARIDFSFDLSACKRLGFGLNLVEILLD